MSRSFRSIRNFRKSIAGEPIIITVSALVIKEGSYKSPEGEFVTEEDISIALQKTFERENIFVKFDENGQSLYFVFEGHDLSNLKIIGINDKKVEFVVENDTIIVKESGIRHEGPESKIQDDKFNFIFEFSSL